MQPQKANPLTPDGQPDWDRLADTLYCDQVGYPRTAWADLPEETRTSWRKRAKARAYDLAINAQDVLGAAMKGGTATECDAAILAHALLAVELVAVHTTAAPDLGAYVPPERVIAPPVWDEVASRFKGPKVPARAWMTYAAPIITGDSMTHSAPGRPLWVNVGRVLGGGVAGALAGFVGLSALVLLPQGYAGFIIVTSFIAFAATIGALVAERVGRR